MATGHWLNDARHVHATGFKDRKWPVSRGEKGSYNNMWQIWIDIERLSTCIDIRVQKYLGKIFFIHHVIRYFENKNNDSEDKKKNG